MAASGGNLASREVEVLSLVADGHSNKEIARELTLSPESVKTYLNRISGKTAARNRAAMAAFYIRMITAEVPPGALAGYWMSRYDFDSYLPNSEPRAPKYRRGAQINLEKLDIVVADDARDDKYLDYTGASIDGVTSEKKVYLHDLRLRVVRRIVIGTWENSNTSNVGVLQLCVHSDLSAMHGGHLGNTSNGVVKAARWVWLRVAAPPATLKLTPGRLKSFAQLENLFRARADGDLPELGVQDLLL